MSEVKPIHITSDGVNAQMAATDTIPVANIPAMVPASAVSPGVAGLFPAGAAGDQDKVAYADGTWRTPLTGNLPFLLSDLSPITLPLNVDNSLPFVLADGATEISIPLEV